MPSMHIRTIEAGAPIKVLTGVHFGCFELIANDSINSIMDLKGKRVGVWALRSTTPHVLILCIMASYVGLDPVQRHPWVQARGRPNAGASSMGRSMRSSPARPNSRNCAPRRSATSLSAPPPTVRGRSISAAWSLASRTMCANTRSPPSASCAPSSSPPTSALGPEAAARELVDRRLRRPATTTRCTDAARVPVRQLAGLRSRGHAALLCTAHAGDGHDQVEPASRSSPRAPTGAS